MKPGGAAVLVGVIFCTLAGATAAQNYKRTDSRKPYVHRIPLFDVHGQTIGPKSREPYSPRKTCGPCHDVATIERGLHSNAATRAAPLAEGEPWVFVDARSGTVVPVSLDGREGALPAASLGLDPHRFLRTFGSHLAGGGETLVGAPSESGRFRLSGSLELDCMACHEAGARWDQGAWSKAVHKELFRWAPTAAMGLARVEGTLKGKAVPAEAQQVNRLVADSVEVVWRPEIFDRDGKVFFEVVRESPDAACLACHGDLQRGPAAPPRVLQAKDVHTTAGLSCVDCHRSGLDHAMTRGVPGSPGADDFSCAGCHLDSGRLGAPRPRHGGMPAVHFQRLSCTACHAGPASPRVHLQTPRAHGLGLARQDRTAEDPPRVSVVFRPRPSDGRLTPTRVFWPTFWARRRGDSLSPVAPSEIARTLRRALRVRRSFRAEMDGVDVFHERMTKALAALGTSEEGQAVFVAGNGILSVDSDGKLVNVASARRAAVGWSLAHPVRPARRALGARGCGECHEAASEFLTARVEADRTVPGATLMEPWVPLDTGLTAKLQRMARAWGARRLFKVLLWAGSVVLTFVLVAAPRWFLRRPSSRLPVLARTVFLLTTGLLVGTSGVAWWRGEAITGIPLLAHMPLGLIWIWSLVGILAVRGIPAESSFPRVSRFLMFLAAWAATIAASFLFTTWFDQEDMAMLLGIHRWASLAAVVFGLPLWLRLQFLGPRRAS